MKLLKSAALVSSVVAFRIANEEEIKFNCVGLPNGVNFNNPENCNQFFNCSNGIAKIFDCPNEGDDVKLQFSIETRTCEWADIAECDADKGKIGWENCYGLENDVKYAAIDVNQYFTCVDGEKQNNANCEGGYVFDIFKRDCVVNDAEATTWKQLHSTGKIVNAFQAEYAQRNGGKLNFKGSTSYEQFYAYDEAALIAAGQGDISSLEGAANASNNNSDNQGGADDQSSNDTNDDTKNDNTNDQGGAADQSNNNEDNQGGADDQSNDNTNNLVDGFKCSNYSGMHGILCNAQPACQSNLKTGACECILSDCKPLTAETVDCSALHKLQCENRSFYPECYWHAKASKILDEEHCACNAHYNVSNNNHCRKGFCSSYKNEQQCSENHCNWLPSGSCDNLAYYS